MNYSWEKKNEPTRIEFSFEVSMGVRDQTHEKLSHLAHALDGALKGLIEDGATVIHCSYENRIDRETNPDGNFGLFVITAERPAP